MKKLSLLVLLLTQLGPLWARLPQEDPQILGKPSAIQPPTRERQTVHLEAGARLRQAPRSGSPVLEILELSMELPVLEQRGPWVKVRFGSWNGWVLTTSGSLTATEVLPLSVTPDQNRLARARSILGGDRRAERLGPLTLYTDVDDTALLSWLDAVASDALVAYRERFGLDPGSEFEEVVVIFAKEPDYRDFVAAETRIAEVGSHGYTTEGLSILYVDRLSRTSLVSVFLHELTHLLNRKVFRAAAPPWLEEGMAEDLAFSRVTAEGEIQLGTLAGIARQGLHDSHRISEPRAHVAALAEASSTASLPDLATLVNLEWEEFVHPDQRALHYSESAMLLRLLLDGEEGELEGRFLGYLETVAPFELPAAISLWDTLQTDPEELDRALHRFIMAQARAHGL